MSTLSALFNLSRSALVADQAALNATATNVSNQNTVGYTRQVVNWHAGVSLTLGDGSVSSTSGPTVTTTSKRDRVLEQRVQQQTQTQAGTSSRADALASIEDVFNISGSSATAGSTQIGTSLNALYSSFTALAASPADSVTRAGVLSAAKSLALAFNSADSQLGALQTSIGGELKSSVAAVNSLSSTIARLNGQISANSPGGDAGSLEDQRQQAIAELSQYVGLDQIQTEQNGITLTTQGGTVLVAGASAYALSAVNTGSSTEIRDGSGTDVSGTISGGGIGGQLTAQNVDLPGVRSALDAVAYRVATAVNAQNAAGVDAKGNAGAAIFVVTATPAGAAGSLAVIATGGSALAAAATGEGATGNGNANAFAALATTADATGETIDGQFATLLGNIGTQSSALQEQTSAQSATLTQLTTQRDSLSGVSLDEEAANLSQYQRAYEAAAKLFSILDSLLTASINLGQQTTYS